jgi:hypothetical protein
MKSYTLRPDTFTLNFNVTLSRYVSPSQLRGLLPAAITEQYTFWQRVSGTSGTSAGGGAGGSNTDRGSDFCGLLTGYIRPRWRRRAAARRDGLGRLVVTIVPGSSDSASKLGDALVQRFPLIPMERSGTSGGGGAHNAGAGLRLLCNGSGGGGLDGGEDGGDGSDGSDDEDADVNRASKTRRHRRRGEEDENAVQESLIGVGSSDMIDHSRPPMTLISLAHVSQRSSDGGTSTNSYVIFSVLFAKYLH